MHHAHVVLRGRSVRDIPLDLSERIICTCRRLVTRVERRMWRESERSGVEFVEGQV